VSSHPRENAEPESKIISYRRLVDLSHVVHSGIPQWPGDPPVQFSTVSTIGTEGYSLRRVSLGEHSGTHMNAPSSFHSDGLAIDDYDTNSLVVPASVIDVTEMASINLDFELDIEHVACWEQTNGRIESGSIVLLNTGWSEKWGIPDEYLGLDHDGVSHFPGFGIDAVKYLLSDRGISGAGIDTHGVDPGRDNSFAVNRMMLQQPRLVLENLTNLDQLPPTGATVVIGLIRLQGGSGSPVSVMAFIP